MCRTLGYGFRAISESERSEKGYRFSGLGLKRGMKNHTFWSEIENRAAGSDDIKCAPRGTGLRGSSPFSTISHLV